MSQQPSQNHSNEPHRDLEINAFHSVIHTDWFWLHPRKINQWNEHTAEVFIIRKISKPRVTVTNEWFTSAICPQLQTATDPASWSNSFVLPKQAAVSRGFEALTYSSCFKAPLASPWEELLSEEGDTGLQGLRTPPTVRFGELTESWRVERRGGSGKRNPPSPCCLWSAAANLNVNEGFLWG